MATGQQTTPRTFTRAGLAHHVRGAGPPLLLMPYPHASAHEPMVEGPLSELLVTLGRTVVTFDPPGAFASTRAPKNTLDEMLGCADEVSAELAKPLDVVGHSMGSVCALAWAIARPEAVRRLLLVGTVSGFRAVARHSVPGSVWRPWQRDWWRCTWWGVRLASGLGTARVHKQLDNLIERVSFVDPRYVRPRALEFADRLRRPPPRAGWLRHVPSIELARGLPSVRAKVLLCVGTHDPQTPPVCTHEVARGLRDARVVEFERSGHSPHIEERERFAAVARAFLEAP